MREILRTVADLLERAEILDPDAAIRGYIGDQLVTFEMKTKQSGSLTLTWTEVSVPLHAGIALLLSIRRSTPDQEQEKARGLAVDLVLGDPAFDAAFIVEGAPERLVRALVDEEVQRSLLALAPDQVVTSEDALVVQMQSFVEDAGQAALLVRTAARIGATAAEIGERQRADAGRVDAAGYRGEGAPGGHARDKQEIEALVRTIAMRKEVRRKEAKRAAIVIGAILLVCAIGFLLLDR